MAKVKESDANKQISVDMLRAIKEAESLSKQGDHERAKESYAEYQRLQGKLQTVPDQEDLKANEPVFEAVEPEQTDSETSSGGRNCLFYFVPLAVSAGYGLVELYKLADKYIS